MNTQPTSLFHLVQPPQQPSNGKPPLLLLLHGVGSNEEDLFSFAPMMDPRFVVVSARGPITLQRGAYAWYHVTWTADGPIHTADEAEQSRQQLVGFLDDIVTQYDVDPARVFI